MIEIIPTILAKDFKEIKEKIEKVENHVNWVQLDIMDGVFVNNETWNNPKDLKKLKTKVKIEAHLMIDQPENVFKEWLSVADRIVFHFEAKIKNRDIGIKELIKEAHKKNKQVGIALNPETHYAVVTPFLKELDSILFMSVQPGWGGQNLKDWVLIKIESLRKQWPKGNIGIDGGINDENIKKVLTAGANLIYSGTYILKSKNIEKAIQALKNAGS